MSSKLDFISERMSVQRSEGRLSVVISAKVEQWKEALLFAWVLAWTACMVLFIMELLAQQDRQMKLMLIIMLTFMAYFELRMVRALLWRKFGKESLRVKDGVLRIKNDIKGYGKVREFFAQNIQELQVVQHNERSFKFQMNSSFWVVGGDSVSFKEGGKQYLIGKGLNQQEAKGLVKVLKRALAEQRDH